MFSARAVGVRLEGRRGWREGTSNLNQPSAVFEPVTHLERKITNKQRENRYLIRLCVPRRVAHGKK